MRVASYQIDGRRSWGLVEGDTVSDLAAVLPDCPTVEAAIARGLGAGMALPDASRHALSAIRWEQPVSRPERIICCGLNYRDHVAEASTRGMPDVPSLFLRTLRSMTAHEGPIVRPHVSDHLDYEGELCVVIGKPGRNLSRENALDHVFGYTCFNDGSVRDFQKKYKAVAGKNFPSTGGVGPWIVTPDDMPDPKNLGLRTRLNGETVQETNTSKMIFDIREILATVSVFDELRPGDLVMTGTPEGVGQGRTPPLWMKPGDVVEVEIDGIGVLRNTVVQED